MLASQLLLSTQKENPSDAEVISQAFMLRAGMIRQLASGIYSYLPLGLRSIRKVEAIVRQEMSRAGALELLMPVIQPAELWQQSGRFTQYGQELLRFRDRHQRDFVVQPTSEEVITDLARTEIKSYRRLPITLYHIQTKFRDERRPRFGVMRAREFTMKDAYSFDRDQASAHQSYKIMFDAYMRIFSRMGFEFRAVAADSGAIGGNMSQEFHVIANTGEDTIAYCPNSDFAANLEQAQALPLLPTRSAAQETMQRVATPGQAKCIDVANYLGLPLTSNLKSIVLATDTTDEDGHVSSTKVWLLLLRGDHTLNEIKASKIAGLKTFRFATEAEILEYFGCEPGYLGPVQTKKKLTIVADSTVANMSDFVTGANQVDYHYRGVNWGRDLPEPDLIADIRNVETGDPSPDGKGSLELCRGIEVGHIFYLGTKYSEAMKATFLSEQGKSEFFEMGCYGIGITRILAACIEQNHDERGIIWPDALAPFTWVICPIGADRSSAVKQAAENLYQQMQQAGIDVVLDDRGERPGAMFADWELIGVPHRLVISDRGLSAGTWEYKHRRTGDSQLIQSAELMEFISKRG